MNFERHILKNGMRVIFVPLRENPTVTVMTLVATGSDYEEKKLSGISHFLEHMCFKGTEKRPNSFTISSELDGIGANYNAFTGHEYTGYYAKCDKRHVDAALDVVSDIYLNSTLPEAEIKKEKGVIVEEIRMYNDQPEERVGDLYQEHLYGDQPAGWNIAGRVETVSSFTREDFVKYKASQYKAKNTVLIVSGNFDQKKTLAKVKAIFSVIPKGRPKAKPKTIMPKAMSRAKASGGSAGAGSASGASVFIEKRNIDQAHIVLGFPGLDIYDKRVSALQVLRGVFSGGMSARLFQTFREKMGVGYYVRSNYGNAIDHGDFHFAIGVDANRVEEVVKALAAEIDLIKNKIVDQEELNRVKDRMTGRIYLGLESSDDFADFYGFQEIYDKKLEKPKEKVAKINKVTAKEVQALARDIFDMKKAVFAMVAPEKVSYSAENIKNMLS